MLLIGIQAGGWLSKNYLSAPTQAPTRYAEVGNRVELGDEEEYVSHPHSPVRAVCISLLYELV
jgi:hypothetical protein